MDRTFNITLRKSNKRKNIVLSSKSYGIIYNGFYSNTIIVTIVTILLIVIKLVGRFGFIDIHKYVYT